VTHSRGAAVEAASLGAAGTREIEIEADGELVGALPARFSVLPAALSLLA
jgi:diacylglycerol kinase family enzyme